MTQSCCWWETGKSGRLGTGRGIYPASACPRAPRRIRSTPSALHAVKRPEVLVITHKFNWRDSAGPKARYHISLGQRPRAPANEDVRAESPLHRRSPVPAFPKDEAGFQPSLPPSLWAWSWAVGPGWYGARRWRRGGGLFVGNDKTLTPLPHQNRPVRRYCGGAS